MQLIIMIYSINLLSTLSKSSALGPLVVLANVEHTSFTSSNVTCKKRRKKH